MSGPTLSESITLSNAQQDLVLRGVSREFATATALCDITVILPAGQFSVLLGPSGCGKSTLLRLVAGLDHPTSGEIALGGQRIDHLPPKARNLSMVFQSCALFPHLDVSENILFGLSVRRVPKHESAQRLAQVAALMGLSDLLSRKPSELSGGQQQRVALARAVISERPVCLMDEPLSNLDAKLRAEMRSEIRSLQQRLGLTMVYVTHDQVEAMTMADRIVVMKAGRIEQVADPRALYSRPATVFVASFIGTPPMNLVPSAQLPWIDTYPGTQTIGIRPEDIALGAQEEGAQIAAEVHAVEYLGADQLITLNLETGRMLLRQPGQTPIMQGRVVFTLPRRALHFFDTAGQRLPSPSDDHTSIEQEATNENHLEDPSFGNCRARADGAGRMGG